MIKDLFFKVKKVEVNGDVYTGVITPHFDNLGWPHWNISLSDEFVDFHSLNGDILKLKFTSYEFKTTRITDKKVRDTVNEVIVLAKEDFKLKMKVLDLKREHSNVVELIRGKDSEISSVRNKLISCQGILSKFDFINKIESMVSCSYNISLSVRNGKITQIELSKEYDLGKYINDGDYSFLYIEDGDVQVFEDCDDDKQLKDIKVKHFKAISTNKICGYTISECFYPSGGGDKRSAGVYQEFSIDLKNGLELTEKNIPKVVDILKELFNSWH